MPRLFALNLNHRTRPMPVARTLVDAIVALRPDVLIFNEYVHQGPALALPEMLESAGFAHCAISDSVEYRPGRWHNQILIASNQPIQRSFVPNDGPDEMCRTNTLTVSTHELLITGLRVPAYKRARDWYRYWEWMNDGLIGDVAIGDFNADPSRNRKWDRVLDTLVETGSWLRSDIEGDWSYRGNNGSTSKVDHVITRGGVMTTTAQYIADSIAPAHTDHAAVLADIMTE